MTIKKIIFIFLILNCLFSICALFLISYNAFVNLQVAFWSAFFIILGSGFAYLRNINKRVALYDKNYEQRDEIDIIDDKFDLYSEMNEKEDLSKEEIHQIIQEEKSKIKRKDSIKNTFNSIGAVGSIYRIVGYLLLVVGFFYLKNNQILEPLVYLLGFLIVPLMALIVQYNQKNIDF
jgi:hypothetical protein